MNTGFFISWRYLMTKRKEKFLSLISLVSVLGVAIGVAALIVVISVMSGFDEELRDKIIGNYSHITVAGYGAIPQQEYDALAEKIAAHSGVKGISPYVQGQILLKHENRFFAVGLKGIDPAREASVTKIDTYLKEGSLANLPDNGIIIGRELAVYLGVGMGSTLTTYSPLGKERKVEVAGIFSCGMYDYDMNLVFSNLKTAQETFNLKDQVSAIALRLDDPSAAARVKAELEGILGFDYVMKTWAEANKNFFAALELEKLAMFIILTLIVLVASFNIISTLSVMVVEKTKDIGVLRSIGMTARDIRRIFTYEGLLIGIMGIAWGTAGGLALCGLLKKYQFIKLPRDIYYIERLPVSVRFVPDVALIVAAAMAITLVAAVYPARKAAALRPVEALRYE